MNFIRCFYSGLSELSCPCPPLSAFKTLFARSYQEAAQLLIIYDINIESFDTNKARQPKDNIIKHISVIFNFYLRIFCFMIFFIFQFRTFSSIIKTAGINRHIN